MTLARTGRAALVALVALLAACGEDAAAPSGNTVPVAEPVPTVAVDGGVLDGSWRAVGATVDGVDVSDLDTVEVTLEVSGGSASGSSGCNSYVRPVTIDAGTIEFGPAEVSEAGCTGPIGEIEGQFRQLTNGPVDWSIADGVLTLTTSRSVWVFERTGAAPTPTTGVTTTPATSPPAAEPAVSAVEVRPVGVCFPVDGESPAPDASLGQAVLADRRGEERCIVGPAIGSGPVFEPTATVSSDPATGDWVVTVEVRPDARAAWDALTDVCYRTDEPCASGRIAIVLGGEILTAPTVVQPVLPEVQISGAFTEAEAAAVAAAINGSAAAGLDPAGGLDGPLIYRPEGLEVGNATFVAGTLQLDAGCLFVDDHVIVWPYLTRWDASTMSVVLPDGSSSPVGDAVELAGALYDPAIHAPFTDQEAVVTEIGRCRRTDTTLLFVAA